MTIGERIKKIRLEKGMTQKEVAEKCGLFDSAIRRYESGRQNPKIETVEKIANALDVTISDLMPTLKLYLPQTEISSEPEEDFFITVEDVNKFIPAFKEFLVSKCGVSPSEVVDITLNNIEDITKNLYDNSQKILNADTIIHYYKKLNFFGKKEAIKRVEELTEIPKYTKPDNED